MLGRLEREMEWLEGRPAAATIFDMVLVAPLAALIGDLIFGDKGSFTVALTAIALYRAHTAIAKAVQP